MNVPAFCAAWMQLSFSLPISTGTSGTVSLPIVAWIRPGGCFSSFFGVYETYTVGIGGSLLPVCFGGGGELGGGHIADGPVHQADHAALGGHVLVVGEDRPGRGRQLRDAEVDDPLAGLGVADHFLRRVL